MNDILRVDLLAKLALAVVLGGAIGFEREFKGKPAGLRTNILICVGAALITDVSVGLAVAPDGSRVGDPARLAAQIVSGIGFIGAGTILHGPGVISGLTSAATIWVVAAIGISIGAGHFIAAAGTGGLVAIVLAWLGPLEQRVRRLRRVGHFTIRCHPGTTLESIRDSLADDGLMVLEHRSYDHRNDRTFELRVRGPAAQFEVAPASLLQRGDILTVHVG